MKHLLYLLSILLLASCNQYDYKIEKELYKTLETAAKSSNVDITKELKSYEKYLIDKNVLKSSKGRSYIQFLNELEKTNVFNYNITYSLQDTISIHSNGSSLEEIQTSCSEDIYRIVSRKEFQESKLNRLNGAMDSLATHGNISISSIAHTIKTILTAKDFEEDYYKMTVLLVISSQSAIKSRFEMQNNEMYDDEHTDH